VFTEIARRAPASQRPPAWRALLDALATPHGADRYLEWIRPTWTLGQVRARLVRVAHPTPHHVTLHLRPNRRWTGFAAGQHVELGVEIDGVRRTRCYSPAGSACRPGEIELTIAVHPEGKVSPWLRDHAWPGQVFDLSPARGDFVLPDPRPERVLLVSGGSGITPVLSMLRTLCDEGHAGPVTFLHYAASPGALPYATELARTAAAYPNVRVLRVFREHPEAGELQGRFGRAQIRAAEPDYAAAETFVCGPERLLDAVTRLFDAEGLGGRLHTESFTPLRYRVRPDAARARVHCRRSGVVLEGDGRSLLELAEAAGLAPGYGCRRGICHTCVRRMTAGSVRHVVTGATLTATDVDVQLCVQAPVGDVHIDL
jgi:stearoyl-CoA 9-desaturase NADPH oxidoreductase